jgi:hypothetical protein
VAIQDESITNMNGFIGYGLRGDGKIIAYGNGVGDWTVDLGTWLLSGNSEDYEAIHSVGSGSWAAENPGAALNTWLRLTSGSNMRYYTNSAAGAYLIVQIRPYGGGSVLDSATITKAT